MIKVVHLANLHEFFFFYKKQRIGIQNYFGCSGNIMNLNLNLIHFRILQDPQPSWDSLQEGLWFSREISGSTF